MVKVIISGVIATVLAAYVTQALHIGPSALPISAAGEAAVQAVSRSTGDLTPPSSTATKPSPASLLVTPIETATPSTSAALDTASPASAPQSAPTEVSQPQGAANLQPASQISSATPALTYTVPPSVTVPYVIANRPAPPTSYGFAPRGYPQANRFQPGSPQQSYPQGTPSQPIYAQRGRVPVYQLPRYSLNGPYYQHAGPAPAPRQTAQMQHYAPVAPGGAFARRGH